MKSTNCFSRGVARWRLAAIELAGGDFAVSRLPIALRAVSLGRTLGQCAQPRPARRNAAPNLPARRDSAARVARRPTRLSWGQTIDSYSINTPFDSRTGVDLRKITDGTSGTVLIFEADTPGPLDQARRPALVAGGSPAPPGRQPRRQGAMHAWPTGGPGCSIRRLGPISSEQLLTVNGGEINSI